LYDVSNQAKRKKVSHRKSPFVLPEKCIRILVGGCDGGGGGGGGSSKVLSVTVPGIGVTGETETMAAAGFNEGGSRASRGWPAKSISSVGELIRKSRGKKGLDKTSH
jgi:hypothetical protein